MTFAVGELIENWIVSFFLIYFCNTVLFLLTLTVSCFFTFKISINIHTFHYVDKTYYCALRKYFGTFREKTAQVYFQCKVASSAASVCKGNLCSNSIITKGSHFIYNEKKKNIYCNYKGFMEEMKLCIYE